VDHTFVAPVYDLLAALWSGGGIEAAKRWAPSQVGRGERVLFAGVGAGRDAAEATRREADVVGVDLSGAMLSRAARRAGPRFLPRRGDVRDHDPEGGYDLVCAHYFLNVFGAASMPGVFAALARCVRPGGRLSIADFAPGPGLLRAIHYRVPATAFRLLGLCEDHPIHDYAPLLDAAGFDVAVEDFRVFGIGPRWHRAWVGTRRASAQGDAQEQRGEQPAVE